MTEKLCKEEADKLKGKYGMSKMCGFGCGSMYVSVKYIKHPEATKKFIPVVWKCLLNGHEEDGYIYVKDGFMYRAEKTDKGVTVFAYKEDFETGDLSHIKVEERDNV